MLNYHVQLSDRFLYTCYVQFTRYIQLVKKHGLEISQPGLEPNNGLTWQMTKRRGDREVHKYSLSLPPLRAWACLVVYLSARLVNSSSAFKFYSFSSALMNRDTEEKPGWCSDPHLPPCAA